MNRLILLAAAAVFASISAAHAEDAAPKKPRFSLPSISLPSFKRGPKDAPKLQVFTGPHYTGHAKLYDASVRDLPRGYNDAIASARVIGQWRLCEDKNFGGRCETVQADIPDMAALNLSATLSSAAYAKGSAGPRPQAPAPSLTFYSAPDYQGETLTVTDVTSKLAKAGFNDKPMSARAVGKWRVCENDHFTGKCRILDGDIRNLGLLRGRVSSAAPVGKRGWRLPMIGG